MKLLNKLLCKLNQHNYLNVYATSEHAVDIECLYCLKRKKVDVIFNPSVKSLRAELLQNIEIKDAHQTLDQMGAPDLKDRSLGHATIGHRLQWYNEEKGKQSCCDNSGSCCSNEEGLEKGSCCSGS